MNIEYKRGTDAQNILLQSVEQDIRENGVSGNSVIAVSSILNLDSGSCVRLLCVSLLAATDWTANSDVTMSDAMRVYRQALRDVPSQAGFPDNVTWPDKPAA